MTNKKLNSAQALLEHIGLKVGELQLFGALIHVKQWSASQRIKYMNMITNSTAALDDEIALCTPQAVIVALSITDDKGKPLFPSKWENDAVVFDDPEMVSAFVENRMQETSYAFVEISKFNGVLFGNVNSDDDDEENSEEIAVKN
jgi:hypothetical protein